MLALVLAAAIAACGSDAGVRRLAAGRLGAAEVVRTTGGHHFDGDYAALAARILAGAKRRVAARADAGTPPDPHGPLSGRPRP